MREKTVILWITRAVIAVLVAAVLAYPLDWAVWRIRLAAGTGLDTVTVNHFTVATLKGNKSSYYFDGSETQTCSRSLFPEAGSGACWWLRRHTEVLSTY
jgi:hypothetical protein